MNIIALESQEQLDEIANAQTAAVILKHNTTCPISRSMKINFEKEGDVLPRNTVVYMLDLLEHRNVSNAIEAKFSVTHESPQILLIQDGACSYNASLYDISAEEVANALHSES
jgi:bacillithiol system protein YtxJ